MWFPEIFRRAFRALRLGRLLAALLVAGASTACAPSTPPLEFEYAGCLHSLLPLDDPTCVIDRNGSDLKIWARSTPGVRITVEVGGARYTSDDAEKIDGGFLFRLPSVTADRLTITAGQWSARQRMALALEAATPWQPPSDPDPAVLSAEDFAAMPAGDRGDRLRWEARRTPQEAAKLLEEAARAFEEAERRSATLGALTAQHYMLTHHLDRPIEADQVLENLPSAVRGDALSFFFVAFNRGAWANRNGRFRAALRHLESAVNHSRRLDLGLRFFPEQERAHLLSRLGRHGEAQDTIAWLEEQLPSLEPALHRAKLLANIGWSRLLMAEAGQPVDPIPTLEKSLEEARTAGAPELIRNAELNLALAHLQQERPRAAKEPIARLRLDESGEQIELPWWIELWALEVEARLALAEGKPAAALKLYSRLAEEPESAFYPDAAWRAAQGRGRALEAMDRIDEAVGAYGEAEALLDRVSLAVPLDQGRRGSIEHYRRGTLEFLDLLVRLERFEDALRVVRNSRARFFRGLVIDQRLGSLSPAQQASWLRLTERYRGLKKELTSQLEQVESIATSGVPAARRQQANLEEEMAEIFDGALELLGAPVPHATRLTRPEAETLWLVYHPLPTGWLAMAVRQGDLHAVRVIPQDFVPDMSPEDTAEAFLAPFAKWIDDAQELRILPHRELWDVPFESLPWRGEPLVAAAAITYALDLPARDQTPSSRLALLITDPTDSLNHAPEEVTAVARHLRTSFPEWRVQARSGDSLTVTATLQDLEDGPDLFHFAGHGDLLGHTAQSGLVFTQGFDSTELLSIHDVLTLKSTPETVVLSGCDTVRRAARSGVELGIGQAFLLAGSQHVVGAIERVEDETARRAMELFYDTWQGPGGEAAALRQAQLELHRRGVEGWSSFRVLAR